MSMFNDVKQDHRKLILNFARHTFGSSSWPIYCYATITKHVRSQVYLNMQNVIN